MRALVASSKVAGRRSIISVRAGLPKIKEFPKSWFEKAKLSENFNVKLNPSVFSISASIKNIVSVKEIMNNLIKGK